MVHAPGRNRTYADVIANYAALERQAAIAVTANRRLGT
jgi:hypothetical protein